MKIIKQRIKEEIEKITNEEDAIDLVAQNGYNYFYLNVSLKSNKKIAKVAVKKDADVMADCPAEFKDDFNFAMDVVSFQPMAVEFVSTRLKDNFNIIVAAVVGDANALQYASPRLRNNAKVVLKAIECDPLSIIYASDFLREISGSSPEKNLKKFISTENLFNNLNEKMVDKVEKCKKVKI